MFNPELLTYSAMRPHNCAMVNKIGSQIIAGLARAGKNQSWLADQLDVSPAAVSKWVSTGIISRHHLVAVAALLGMSVDELVTGDTPPLDALVSALPSEQRREIFSYITYQLTRADHLMEPDKAASYAKMIESIRKDMEARKSEE